VDAANLQRVGSGIVTGCIWGDLGHADASLADGLWIPLQQYGVFGVPVTVAP